MFEGWRGPGAILTRVGSIDYAIEILKRTARTGTRVRTRVRYRYVLHGTVVLQYPLVPRVPVWSSTIRKLGGVEGRTRTCTCWSLQERPEKILS